MENVHKIIPYGFAFALILIVTTLLGGLYEHYLMPYYAEYKMKQQSHYQTGCIYFDKHDKNRWFNTKTIHKRTSYFLLNQQRVSMGYSPSSKISREQYGDLYHRLILDSTQCQSIVYIQITYFNGIFIKKKIFVFDDMSQPNNHLSTK